MAILRALLSLIRSLTLVQWKLLLEILLRLKVETLYKTFEAAIALSGVPGVLNALVVLAKVLEKSPELDALVVCMSSTCNEEEGP